MIIDDHRLSTCRSLFHGSFMLHIDPYTVMLLYNLGSPKDAFSAYSTQSSQLCNSICFLFRKWVLNCENWLASSHSLGRATILWPHHGHADPAGVAVGFHHGLGRIKIGHICHLQNPRTKCSPIPSQGPALLQFLECLATGCSQAW